MMRNERISANEAVAHRIPEDRANEAHMSWRGDHLTIGYSTNYWGAGSMCDGYGMFNSYVFIREDACPDGLFDSVFWLKGEMVDSFGTQRVSYDYYSLPFEFDSEVACYEKIGGLDGEKRCIKAGCDYGHLWHSERGHPDTLESVERDIKRTIEKLRDKFPDLLWKCAYSGTWHPKDQMVDSRCGLVFSGNKERAPAAWFEIDA